MKTFTLASALLAAVATAAPTAIKRDADIDPVILNFALTLENLESAFYKQGLANYTAADFAAAGFTDQRFYKNLKQVAADEATHVAALKTALKSAGDTPVKPCKYNFGVSDANSFIELAQVFEGVGVSAYLGAAALVTNKALLTTAASIVTIEARHNAFFRTEQSQFPFPSAFDTPLTVNQVWSLASSFIVSCPSSNPKLPVTAYPSLTATLANRYHKNAKITFNVESSADLSSTDNLFVAWPTATGPIYMPATANEDGTISSTIPNTGNTGVPAGQAYAILVNGNSEVADENTIAGPAIVNIFAKGY